MFAAEADLVRLAQLSEELRRIAFLLVHLSAETTSEGSRAASDAYGAELSTDLLSAIIRARQMRSRYIANDLFAEPAWDMMLELLEAEITQRRVTVSKLCNAAEVPSTTALRWLDAIVDKGIAIRRPDRFDSRLVYVELCDGASAALRRYFAELMRA